jgi:outer membrane protein
MGGCSAIVRAFRRGLVVLGAWPVAVALVAAWPVADRSAWAETLPGALAKAYLNNPDLNQQRAAVRATDETVPQATAGYRPTVTLTSEAGPQYTRAQSPNGAGGTATASATTWPRDVSLSVTQNLFNGNRTGNAVREAESNVLGGRETLRNTEQNVLQSGAQFYMDVLRDTAILNLDTNNVDVLLEQLRQTRDRFAVGEVTRTDVAQAEASLAQGRSQALTAQSNLRTSIANYRQVIGVDPKMLEPGRAVDRGLPKTLEASIAISQMEHPSIQAALHGVDAAELNVKILEGALYPTVNVVGNVTDAADVSGTPKTAVFSASVIGQISIPIYDGGLTFANIRQGKEQLGQQRLVVDQQRDIVRQAVVSAWGVFSNSKAQIESAQAQVSAAEIALNGVREEAKVGQRTTLDVLNAQQTLLNARVALVTAQHDRVVASYALLAAIGRLSVDVLALRAERYDATVHFDQVKDKWWGLRTPDGR